MSDSREAMKRLRLFRAEVPPNGRYCGFVCGLAVDDIGVVQDAAPIAHWAEGKCITEFREWAESKGGKVEEIA